MAIDWTTENLIEYHVQAIMEALKLEITDNNKDTPHRIAKMWNRELFKNRKGNTEDLDNVVKIFPNDNYYTDIVTVKDIPFHSICEHHWLPFSGICTVSYRPNDKVIGLSKIPRIVKWFSQKPQLQERLTKEIGDYISNLGFEDVEVIMEAKHQCIMCRGIESDCATLTHYKNISIC